jgi:hypothetical protein
MWMGNTTGSAVPQFLLVNSSDAFNGNQYQSMSFVSGSGRVALLNYGVDCQLGLSLEEGREYQGYVYVRGEAGTVFTVALEETSTGATLASAEMSISIDGEWQRLNFTLSPSVNTSCGATTMQLNGMQQEVYSCSGRLSISLASPGTSIDVDLVYLSPGSWGTMPSPTAGALGLPARLDVAEALLAQSMQSIRIGGSMTLVDGYRWKTFRGPRDLRQPYQGYWYQVCVVGLTESY